jgi:hypothetical protein
VTNYRRSLIDSIPPSPVLTKAERAGRDWGSRRVVISWKRIKAGFEWRVLWARVLLLSSCCRRPVLGQKPGYQLRLIQRCPWILRGSHRDLRNPAMKLLVRSLATDCCLMGVRCSVPAGPTDSCKGAVADSMVRRPLGFCIRVNVSGT